MTEENKKDAKRIGIAMVSGLLIGLILHFFKQSEWVGYVRPLGTVFVRLLKMVIVPLVFSSIFMAMINLGSPRELGKMGTRAVAYYFTTTMVAVFFGMIMVNLIKPGAGADLGTAGLENVDAGIASQMTANKGLFGTVMEVLITSIPENPMHAFADSNVLQIIVFSLMFGAVALFKKQESEPMVNFLESLEKMSLTLTHVIMKFAPLGIFALMLDVMARTGMDAIYSLSKYMLAVVLGLCLHALFLLFVACTRIKKSPLFVIQGLGSALLTAFSTSSSAATLPITMTCVEEELGVRRETAKFVLPLGATINMDGTALYESIGAIFIAQAYGIHLTLGQQIVIFLTASLAAVGAAAIPGAGLITMSIVLNAVGLPLEGVGLILAVDRILDMLRTTVNVFGDAVGTIVVDSLVSHPDSESPSG